MAASIRTKYCSCSSGRTSFPARPCLTEFSHSLGPWPPFNTLRRKTHQSLVVMGTADETTTISSMMTPAKAFGYARERRLVRYKRGEPVRVWKRIAGRRAESLDCMVYALAVRPLVGVDLDRREAEVSTKKALPSLSRVVHSRWMQM